MSTHARLQHPTYSSDSDDHPRNDPRNDPFSVSAPADDPFIGSRRDWHDHDDDVETPLLPPGQKSRRSPSGFPDLAIATILPFLVFFLCVSLFVFAYHDMERIVWILIGLCASLALLFLGLGACARHVAFLAIGFLCFAAVALGTGVGLWLHREYLVRYWELQAGRLYQGVLPTADPKDTRDASVIQFAPSTFVDDKRTLGYVTGGGLLCVAPVVSPGIFSSEVKYWAVGDDCCEKRTNFDCGTSREPGAVSAVTVRRSDLYTRAINQAMSIYGLTSTADAQLVSFVSDTKGAIGDIWDEALTIALIAMIADLCMCAVAGLVLSRVLSTPSPHAVYDRKR